MTSERPSAWACVLLAATLAGCVSLAPPVGDREYLDEQTAATVTVDAHTLVFARERPELAVHARDYLTLVPIDVNRAGAHAQYFFGYLWSTIDKRQSAPESPETVRLELLADGRRIPLTPVAATPRELGLGEHPIPPPSRHAQVFVAPTTREVQAFLADAREVRAVAVRAGAVERLERWGP